MAKKIALMEKNKIEDISSIIPKTDVFVYNKIGEEVFLSSRGPNKVIVSGSAFTMAKHFNMKPNIWTPSDNTVLQLDNSVYEEYEGLSFDYLDGFMRYLNNLTMNPMLRRAN